MKLSSLLQGICSQPIPQELQDVAITSITQDSRQVQPGTLFFSVDGCAAHLREAEQKGAAILVSSQSHSHSPVLTAENPRLAYSLACSRFYGSPASRLCLIGVTGTNGKTSISFLIHHILTCCGIKTGLIGTVYNKIGAVELPAHYTTPDAAQLHQLLAKMEEAGCTHVVLEASSHALAQHRLAGCVFGCAAFSNLTQDHLDYHKTMENYYQAKRQLFRQARQAVLNWDDESGRRLYQENLCPSAVYTVQGDSAKADYAAVNIQPHARGSRFLFLARQGKEQVVLPMPGRFSVENAVAALGTACQLGVPLQDAAQSLACCPGVPGRMEVLPAGADFTVMRDYAHTADGLEKVLSMVRETTEGRIITLFGCAGQRDRTKRREMGAMAARYSDLVILTSDNPRQEPEEQIAQDTIPGLKEYKTPYQVILNREEAIACAFAQCQRGDVLLLAGKGHEDYQALKDKTVYFNERDLVARLAGTIEKNGGTAYNNL